MNIILLFVFIFVFTILCTSLFLCSHSSIWNQMITSTYMTFAPYTYTSHHFCCGSVVFADGCSFVCLYCFSHLSLIFPHNIILYHPILVCANRAPLIGIEYDSTCTVPESSHSIYNFCAQINGPSMIFPLIIPFVALRYLSLKLF